MDNHRLSAGAGFNHPYLCLSQAPFRNAQPVYCSHQQLSCRNTACRLVALLQRSACRQTAAGHRYRHRPTDDV